MCIAIIALLASILLPALMKARELTNRSLCATNIRHFQTAIISYAVEQNDALPDGRSWNAVCYAVQWISPSCIDDLAPYVSDWAISDCPNWHNAVFSESADGKLTLGQGRRYDPAGANLGLIYIGGKDRAWTSYPAADEPWQSPMLLSDPADLPLVADRTEHVTSSWPSKFAHAEGGFLETTDTGTPAALGVAGGNVGRLDSSVIWTPIGQMKPHSANSTAVAYYYW